MQFEILTGVASDSFIQPTRRKTKHKCSTASQLKGSFIGDFQL